MLECVCVFCLLQNALLSSAVVGGAALPAVGRAAVAARTACLAAAGARLMVRRWSWMSGGAALGAQKYPSSPQPSRSPPQPPLRQPTPRGLRVCVCV